MRSVLLPVLGAIVGLLVATTNHFAFGLVAGGLIGWLLDVVRRLRASNLFIESQRGKIKSLTQRVSELERHTRIPEFDAAEEVRDTESPSASAAVPLAATPAVESPTSTGPAEDATHPSAGSPVLPAPEPTAKARAVTPKRGSSFEDHLQRAFDRVKRWFTTGNVPVKVGIIVSFFGVSFLFKYAVDNELVDFPIEARLIGVALAAVALLVIGWRLRPRMRVYGLSLQGGGIGILYLTIYAALRIYNLVDEVPAFSLMVLLTIGAGVLAVTQKARSLAILGTLGGFLAPVLVSTGAGNHVALFSYYLILNGAIFGIAFFQAWRELNLLGFVFTYAIGGLWGYESYQPELLDSTLPFVIGFFFLFVGLSVLYAYRRAYRARDYLDATIVFGTPAVTFAILSEILSGIEYALAAGACTACVVYLLSAALLHRWTTPRHKMLVESFIALGVAFGTIAIPLALDARWTSAAWALEGAAVVWIGARQLRVLARASGAALQIAAGVSFLGEDLGRSVDPLPVLNSDFLGTALIALAGLFVSCYLHRNRERLFKFDRVASLLLLGWGVAWWFSGGLVEIDRHVSTSFETTVTIIFCAATLALGAWIAPRLRWPAIAWPALGLVPLLGVLVVFAILDQSHPFANMGWLAWPPALVLSYWVLRRLEDVYPRWISWLHAPSLWIIAAIGATELGWQVAQLADGTLWSGVSRIAALGALALVVVRGPAAWPLSRHPSVYLLGGVGPLVVVMLIGVITYNLSSSGDPAPLPYLPLLNPLDLCGAFATVVLGMWMTGLGTRDPKLNDPRTRTVTLTAIAFFLSTAMLIRTVHHWAGVPFEWEALFESVIVQAAITLFWGLLALTAMILGARRVRRDIWLTGAGLMGIVVAKLFLIDLGNSDTFARIVSFIGAGLLLLVVGYFAGVPPRQETVSVPDKGKDDANRKEP